MYLAFSALKKEIQEQIKKLIAPLSGEFQYDLRFNTDGPYITSVPKGFSLNELWTWSGGTKYYELSDTHKDQILNAIQRALPNNDYVAAIYGGEGLYNVGTFDKSPSAELWDEYRTASEWLAVLELSPENLVPSSENWEQRYKALEKDMEGQQTMINKLRAILA